MKDSCSICSQYLEFCECTKESLRKFGHEEYLQGSELKEKNKELQQKLDDVTESAKVVSDAYLKVRKLVGAWDTNKGGENRFEVTEGKIKQLTSLKSLKAKVLGLDYARNICETEVIPKWAEEFGLETSAEMDVALSKVIETAIKQKIQEVVNQKEETNG